MPLGVFYGRMNPFTRGHASVVNVIRKNGRKPVLIVTHTQNSETNPLRVNEKLASIKSALGNNTNVQLFSTNGNKKITLFTILNNLKKQNGNIKVWLGSNRIPTIGKALGRYGYAVAQLGEARKNVVNNNRNSPVTNISAMSASRVRKAAVKRQFTKFKSMLPPSTSNTQLQYIFNTIRNRLSTAKRVRSVRK